MSCTKETGYSSSIKIVLLVNGESYRVAQIGPSTMILRDRVDIPANSNAKIVIVLDGKRETQSVLLHHGANREDSFVPYI